ncbi:MAG: hypothetical protein ACT4PN_00845 [Nitrospiraceae bacterium]
MSWVRVWLWTIHRVLGTGMALLVMLWFGSGAVLLFVPYPSLSEEERFRWLEPLQLDGCCVPLELIWNQVGLISEVERVRLFMNSGRPIYVIHFLDGTLKSLWADQGEPLLKVTQPDAIRTTREGQPLEVGSTVETLWDDQWTVHQRFDEHRPLRKIQLHDAEGTEWYLSSTTGELLMDTTAFERQWNTVGALIHWLYVPMLRRHWALWDQTVWWLAAVGFITAVSGLVLGIQHVCRGRGQRLANRLSGIKRWHHLGGMAIGTVVCTWLFSGMLSMDHDRWFSRGEPTVDQRQRFMGGILAPEDIGVQLGDAMRQAKLGDAVKEILLMKVGGASYYVFRSNPEQQVVMSAVSPQAPAPRFSLDTLADAAKTVIPAQQIDRSEIAQGDLYYYSTLHHSRPRSGLRIVLDDSAQTWIHIDTTTGQLIELIDDGGRVYRWLFHGLHSWDIPFLLEYDRQRRLVLLGLCVTGFLFSLSGVYLGILVLVTRAPPKPSTIL